MFGESFEKEELLESLTELVELEGKVMLLSRLCRCRSE